MSKLITVAICGFGLRARDYTNFQELNPGKMKVVAIGETDPKRLEDAAAKFAVEESNCFSSGEELLEQPRLADLILITTQDRQHVPQALKALEKGYHIILEKPISPSLKECLHLQKMAAEYDRSITVCHVMRYTPFFQKIRQILDDQVIGEIVSLQATENVGYFHQAHSFVRGNWRRSDEASPMILAKSCHDMDLIRWLIGKECERVSSYGSLRHFKKEMAPEGASLRCLNNCKVQKDCPYDAEKIYVTDKTTGIKDGIWKWPCSAVTADPAVETIYAALQDGPYGRCVYHCDNDVVDHQVVNMEFEEGVTASFTMCAFTNSDERELKIMGTKGDIIADLQTNLVSVTPFGQESTIYDISEMAGELSGHAGGDLKMVESVIAILSEEISRENLSSIDVSIQSHVMALAAEQSRLNKGESLELLDFIKQS